MGIEDLVNKGKDLFEQNREKIDDALHSEKAEEISDGVLDGAEGLAKKVAPKAADRIDGVRDTIDGKIGNE